MDKIITFSEYSKRAAETQMESCKNEDYLRLGLISEVGELCAIFKRSIRGDFNLENKRQDILLELGDICWYLDRYEAMVATTFGWRRVWGLPLNIGTWIEWTYELSSEASLLRGPSAYCWNCVTIIAYHFNFTIWDVLTANVEKLSKRKERGLIQGSGDHRGERPKEPDAPFCGCDPDEA